MPKLLTALAAAFVLASGGALANDSTPGAVADGYLKAVADEGLGAASRFYHPDALADVAEMVRLLLEAERRSGQSALGAQMFGGGADFDAIAKLPDAELASAFFSMANSANEGMMDVTRSEIVGVIEEDERRHVVYRLYTSNIIVEGAEDMAVLDVMTLQPFGDGWRVSVPSEMDAMVRMLRANLPRFGE